MLLFANAVEGKSST